MTERTPARDGSSSGTSSGSRRRRRVPGYDGWPNVGEVNVAGGIRAPSVEITEERFPFFIKRHELRPGSGGAGTWRGGLGAVCDLVYEGAEPALLNTAGDGVIVPPFGLFGAEPGQPHIYSIISNGQERVLGSKEVGVVVNPGDHIYCLSAGGGGYGEPRRGTRRHGSGMLRTGMWVGREVVDSLGVIWFCYTNCRNCRGQTTIPVRPLYNFLSHEPLNPR